MFNATLWALERCNNTISDKVNNATEGKRQYKFIYYVRAVPRCEHIQIPMW
jgi:hypothetical protein